MTTRLEPLAPAALFEREQELAAIAEHVAAAGGGAGRLLVFEAGAGMGKTRLLAESRTAAAAAGFGIVAARGGELEQEFSFGVVRQLFEPVVAAAEDRSVLLAGAAALSLPLFDPSSIAGGDGGDASFAMLHGLYWLTANLAQRTPLMVVVDDLQWADLPSLRWLSYLARRLDGLPLLLAVASRPPEQGRRPELLAEFLAEPAAVAVPLHPLGHDSVMALARRAFDAEPDAEFVRACEVATGGNPLLLQALLDTLARERAEPSAPSAPRVLATGPDAVSRFIGIRLARLGGEARSLLQAGAVLGDGTALRFAAELAGLPVEVAARTASELRRWELLRGEDAIEFAHPIIRNVVYRGISAGERARAHRRAGELLRAASGSLEQVAAHLLHTLPAGDASVTGTLRLAAERALAEGAPQGARAYLERALAEPPAEADRTVILRLLGLACLHVDAFEAARWLEQAFEADTDPVSRAQTAILYYTALEHVDRFDTAAAVLDRAIGGLEPADRELRELLEALLVECTFWDADLRTSGLRRIEAAAERPFGSGVGAAALRGALAFHELGVGARRKVAVAFAADALESGELLRRGFTAGNTALLALMTADELDWARSIQDEAITDKRRRGDLVHLLPLLLLRSVAARWGGDLLRAEEDLRAPEMELAAGRSVTSLYRAGFLAEVLVERDELREAEQLIASVPADDQVHVGWRIFFLHGRGVVRLAAGRAAEALPEFQRLGEFTSRVAIQNPALAPWRSHAALALRALDRPEEARALASEELELARRWGAPRPIGVSLRALGLIAGGPEGEALLREAVEVLAASPARLEQARALVDLGAALRRRNARAEGREHLREGLELAHRCGGLALVRRAQEELVASGARPRRLTSRGVDALTPSERRVARMAAEGMPNKEIAQSLFVTVKAVEVHLSNTYRKLDIRSRTQLASALAEPAAS